MDVVILAGGQCDDDLAELTGVSERWAIEVDGRTFFDRAFEAATAVGTPLVVGGPETVAAKRSPAGRTYIESLRAGLDMVTSERMLLITADMPDINATALSDLIGLAPKEPDICFPIIPMALCEQQYPGLKRTTLALKEGKFTGGNAVIARTEGFRQMMHVMEQAYESRKSPLKIAKIVGIDALFLLIAAKLFPRFVSVEALERKAGRKLGVSVKAISCPMPELGTDIDSAEQLIAYRALKKTAANTDN